MDSHIKKLRSGGVPAILVFIRDDASMGSKDSGLRWQNMKKNGSFKGIMEEVQKWTKVPVNQNINLVSFSGGYIGQGEALRQTTGTDYGKNITGITCLDSIYGYHDQVAGFARDPSKKVNIVYTDHQNKNAALLLSQIQKQRGVSGAEQEMDGIRIEHSSGSHGGTVDRFEDFLGYMA
jgi:hypothetical protein